MQTMKAYQCQKEGIEEMKKDSRERAVCIKKLILAFLQLCHCFIAYLRAILLYMDQ